MSELVLPAYGRASLADVLPAVGASMGLSPHHPCELVLPTTDSWVVVLIDGLGAELIARYAHVAPYLAELMQGSALGTAGVPSTTGTSLTSFGTGLPPGAHGVVGYASRIPGTERLLNCLQWDPTVDAAQWQPHATMWQRFSEAGIHATVINKAEYETSGLSVAANRGAPYHGAPDLSARIEAALTYAGRERSIVYLYDSELDATGHRYGVASQEWMQQLGSIDAELEMLRERLPAHVRLLVTADHGMIDIDRADHVDVDQHPHLRDGVVLLGGEARLRQVYVQPGALHEVTAAWREFFGAKATVVTQTEAVEQGWFGPMSPDVSQRVGDVLVACGPDLAVMSSVDFKIELSLKGFHGALTPAEMNIPILVA